MKATPPVAACLRRAARLCACDGAAALLVLTQATAATAQDAEVARLGEVVVTGYRAPTLRREATSGITIVTRDDIVQYGALSGADLLRQIPGLQVDQPGGPGGFSSVYIRGSDPNHVLVLIDGVRVNDPTNSRGGGFDLSNLDPASIERVEVLRGAASAVYGADAMGGVVNVVTRHAAGGAPAAEAAAGVGGRGLRTLAGRVSAGGAAGSASLGASRRIDGIEGEGGRLGLTVLTGAVRWQPVRDAALLLDVRHDQRGSAGFPDDSGGIAYAVRRALQQTRTHGTGWNARATWNARDFMTLAAGLSGYERAEDIESPGVAPGVRNAVGIPASLAATHFSRRNLLASATFHLPRGSEFVVGAEWQREHGVNRTTYTLFGRAIPADFDLVRHTRSEFAEMKWIVSPTLLVRGGVRRDAIGDAGTQWSPSAGVRWEVGAGGGALKADYGRGFKPPSFFGLGLPVPLGGNPGLRPEHGEGGAVGYERTFADGRGTVGASYFKTRYGDLITYDNVSNRIVNARAVDIRGVELDAAWRLSTAFTVRGHFTRLLTHVVDSGEPLRQRPGRRAGVQFTAALGERQRVSWSTEYVAEVFDSSIPTGSLTLPTLLRTDLVYNVGFARGVAGSFAIDNLFDRRNEQYAGFVAPGRRLRASMSLNY